MPKFEDTPQSPNSPYSVSKHAAEKYVLYMFDAYKFPATILRPFNTMAGGTIRISWWSACSCRCFAAIL